MRDEIKNELSTVKIEICQINNPNAVILKDKYEKMI